LNDPLAVLAERLPWEQIEASIAAKFARQELRISAIVDACFRLIVDGVSAPSWTRRGCAQVRFEIYRNRPRSI
jgi:hypothetical protein